MGLISFFRNGFVKCCFDAIDQHGLGKFALFLNRNFVNWGTGDQFLFDAFQRRTKETDLIWSSSTTTSRFKVFSPSFNSEL